MKSIKTLVSVMLMSVCAATVFTSCSDDRLDDDKNVKAPATTRSGETAQLKKSIGLCYFDFITPNDVTILDADTTQIAVSKAFADKMGITDFVNRPLGIWQNINQTAYMRRATAQKLLGDRYILTVAPTSIAELLNGHQAELSTVLYVNKNATQTRSGNFIEMSEYAAKYVDENSVYHPAAVRFIAMPGEEEITRGAVSDYGTYTPEQILSGEMYADTRFNPFKIAIDAVGDAFKYVDKVTRLDLLKISHRGNIITFHKEIGKDYSYKCGKEEGDTINVHAKCPIDFDLNYTFKLNAGISIFAKPRLHYFETCVDGTFGINPSLSVGFHKSLSVPADKQRQELARLGHYSFTFCIAGVPVTVDVEPHMYMVFTGKVEGQGYAKIEYKYAKSFKAGCCYDGNKWDKILDSKVVEDKFLMSAAQASFDAKAGIGFYLGVDVQLCKIIGPTLSIGPRLDASAHMSYDKNRADKKFLFKANVNVSVGGEIGAKLKFWKFDITDWHTGYTIYGPKTLWEYNKEV